MGFKIKQTWIPIKHLASTEHFVEHVTPHCSKRGNCVPLTLHVSWHYRENVCRMCVECACERNKVTSAMCLDIISILQKRKSQKDAVTFPKVVRP